MLTVTVTVAVNFTLSDSKVLSQNSIYFAIDKDNLLIASNPKIIESAIEKIDSNILNTKENYKIIKLKENLKDGLLLLEMALTSFFNYLPIAML